MPTKQTRGLAKLLAKAPNLPLVSLHLSHSATVLRWRRSLSSPGRASSVHSSTRILRVYVPSVKPTSPGVFDAPRPEPLPPIGSDKTKGFPTSEKARRPKQIFFTKPWPQRGGRHAKTPPFSERA